MRGGVGRLSGWLAVGLLAALPAAAWAAGGPAFPARSVAGQRTGGPQTNRAFLAGAQAPGAHHVHRPVSPSVRSTPIVRPRRIRALAPDATLPLAARRTHEPAAALPNAGPPAASRAGAGIPGAAGKVGAAALHGAVSGIGLARSLFLTTTTRHTRLLRWARQTAESFATRTRVKLTYLPLTLIMKALEVHQNSLFVNGVLYTLDAAARVGAGGLKLAARESFRYGTMSSEMRRIERATRRGDFDAANEALAKLEQDGSPEAQRARRLILRRAVGGLKGPEEAPRSAQEVAERRAANLERAQTVVAGLSARNKGASPAAAARRGVDAPHVRWVESQLLGLHTVRAEIKEAVKGGAPWKIEAAYALLEGMLQQLDPSYSLSIDRKTGEQRARDLQQANFELAERVALKAAKMARHPKRFARSSADVEAIRQQAAQAAVLARSLLERVEGDPAYAFGPPRGWSARLQRLARADLATLENQLTAGPLTLARQATTDAAIGTIQYLGKVLWGWLSTGNLAHPGNPYLLAAQATALEERSSIEEKEAVALQRRRATQAAATQDQDQRRRVGSGVN